MRWDEVSLNRAEWRIPHTKAGRPHLLPLPFAVVVLKRSFPRKDGNPHVFPGQNGVGGSPEFEAGVGSNSDQGGDSGCADP